MNDNWEHRWFGWWKEMWPTCTECPSIYSFVNVADADDSVNEVLVQYLMSSAIIASTSNLGEGCIISGCPLPVTLSIRTDGVFVWPDDIAHYVAEHHLHIPKKFQTYIEMRKYVPLDQRLLDIESTMPHHEHPDLSSLGDGPIHFPQLDIEFERSSATTCFRNQQYEAAASHFSKITRYPNSHERLRFDYARRRLHNGR